MIKLSLLIIMLSLVFLYIIIPAIVKIFLKKKFLNRLRKSDNRIYLTFDDGPDPESTLKILKLLKKAGAKATFFITGRNAEKYPELVSDIIASGSDIGEHGYNHIHAWKKGPVASLIEMLRSEQAIKKITKMKDYNMYRPPFGKMNIITLLFTIIRRKKIVFWDIDPEDYKADNPQTVADKVIESLNSGCVILLHDGRRSVSLSDRNITVEALKMILDYLKKKKVNFSAIRNGLEDNSKEI